MSGHDMRGVGQCDPMQHHRTVISLQDWRANKMASPKAGCNHATDVGEVANPSTGNREFCTPPSRPLTEIGSASFAAKDTQKPLPKRFDPTFMPEPSANAKRFMEIMSGNEDDPTLAVDVVMFFWRFSRRGMPMPKRALALLDRHAAAGDPACILVRGWLRKKMVRTDRRSLWVFEGGKA